MADLDHEHDELLVLDIADEAVVNQWSFAPSISKMLSISSIV